jgi:signal peptidase II
MTDDAEAEVLSTTQNDATASHPVQADSTETDPTETDPAQTRLTPHQRRPSPLLAIAIVLIVVALDQLAKRWAVSELTNSRPRHVIWTLQWNLTRNKGMAFSQAEGIGPLIGIAALLVVVWLAWSSRMLTSRVPRIAAGLIAGGAIGNLLDRVFRGDRVLHGAVIDFIDFQWFPIFNVADMAIDIGGALFVIWTVFGHRRARSA